MTNRHSYLRNVSVVFEREGQTQLSVEGLRVDFDVKKEVHADPSPSTIKIYNLSRRSEALIAESGARANLFAGYEGRLSRISSGEVRKVEVEKSGPDRIAKVTVGASDRARKETIVSRSYGGAVPMETVLQDVASDMGLTVDGSKLGALPPMSVDGSLDPDSGENVLSSVLRSSGIEWYEVDGELLFSVPGQASEESAFLLNSDTGMIGSPTLTDAGARAKMLLNGDVSLDQELVIESDTVEGRFKVVAISHKGDNWTGEFATELEAVRLNA